jgi:kynurenine formamidase
MKRLWTVAAVLATAALGVAAAPAVANRGGGLWGLYDEGLRSAKYIDLTHTITPTIPVWSGFGPSVFSPSLNPGTGQPYTYATDGFEATSYQLSTDQLGTQLDPPAHWAPEYAAIDELPPTFAVRPLVVISIVKQVKRDFNYHLQVSDIRRFERRHGRIPRGSVVFVRSDWSKDWPDPALATLTKFPGVSLDALKFLHLQRHILFHGHEPLDTDSTPTLEGEYWLMHNGFAQAEGVADLSGVPSTGCLVEIGFPRFGGGLGGYARFVAICPPGTRRGVRIGEVPEAPLQRYDAPLHWDAQEGMRVR